MDLDANVSISKLERGVFLSSCKAGGFFCKNYSFQTHVVGTALIFCKAFFIKRLIKGCDKKLTKRVTCDRLHLNGVYVNNALKRASSSFKEKIYFTQLNQLPSFF